MNRGLAQVILKPFTSAELVVLTQRLKRVADYLLSEVEQINPRSMREVRPITFRQVARMMRWRRYFAELARIVERAGFMNDPPVIEVTDLPLGEGNGRAFLEFLRSEQYRADMDAFSITANALQERVEPGQEHALAIEARFYTCLLNQLGN
jgi:hypothetical protein